MSPKLQYALVAIALLVVSGISEAGAVALNNRAVGLASKGEEAGLILAFTYIVFNLGVILYMFATYYMAQAGVYNVLLEYTPWLFCAYAFSLLFNPAAFRNLPLPFICGLVLSAGGIALMVFYAP